MPCEGVHVIRPMHALVPRTRPRKLHMGLVLHHCNVLRAYIARHTARRVTFPASRAASRTLGAALESFANMHCMRADARAWQGPSYLRIFTGPELVKSRGVER